MAVIPPKNSIRLEGKKGSRLEGERGAGLVVMSSLPGMILNNTTPQLDTLTVDPVTGLSYYPLLSGSVLIGAGTTGGPRPV